MAFNLGSEASFKLDNDSGILTDISSYVNDTSDKLARDTHDTTTYGKSYKTFIAGLLSGSFSLSGKWDATIDVILDAALRSTVTKTFNFSPAGTGGGSVKYYGEVWCKSYDIKAPVNGVVEWSAEFESSDTITKGTN